MPELWPKVLAWVLQAWARLGLGPAWAWTWLAGLGPAWALALEPWPPKNCLVAGMAGGRHG